MASTNEKVSNHIPDDVAFSILSGLPLKSLKRFTCACQSWTLLFQNPYFMNMFRKNFISSHNSLYDDTCLLLKQKVEVSDPRHLWALYLFSGERFENKVRLDWPPPFKERDTGIRILGSGINGILCLYNCWNHKKVVLWNPITQEFKVTLQSLVESTRYDVVVATLHGFGYDHVTNDYKVIRHVDFIPMFNMPRRQEPLWQIYSLRSDSWRKLNVDMPIRYISIAGGEVYLNGVCHWCGKTNMEACVMSFNLSNEVFFTTPLPFDMDGSFYSTKHRHLVLLNGSIAMISNHAKTISFDISILGELGVKESWTKLFIVGPLPWVERPIGTGKNGDIFFVKKDNELACFDLNTQTIEEIGVKGKLCQIVIYKKNLLPIRGMNDKLFLPGLDV